MACICKFRYIRKIGIRKYSCININDAYILSAVRTPFGCFQGALSSVNAVQLASKALTAAIEKSNISKEEIQEIILGCVFPHGLGQGPARQVALFSGLSNEVIATSINKLCASGMKSLMFGCQVLASNTQEVLAVGGTESASNIPYILRRKNMRLGNICVPDAIFHDGLNDVFHQVDVTAFAEETAKENNITRKDQDDYALRSYSCATSAEQNGFFAEEKVPICVQTKTGVDEVICEDEEIKQLDLQNFRDLTPDMGKDGTITTGNSSTLSDGAAMIILVSGNYVLKKNLQPLARVVSYADSAVDPKKFCLSPAIAVRKAMIKANLCLDQISMWEISETFGLTVLVNANLLKLNIEKINIHGGAISLGHPFGATGARLVAHLAHNLKPGEMGCATISHATGGGSAVIIEKMEC